MLNKELKYSSEILVVFRFELDKNYLLYSKICNIANVFLTLKFSFKCNRLAGLPYKILVNLFVKEDITTIRRFIIAFDSAS